MRALKTSFFFGVLAACMQPAAAERILHLDVTGRFEECTQCAGIAFEQLVGTDFNAFISFKLDPVELRDGRLRDGMVSGASYLRTEIDFVADYAGSSVDLSTATFLEVSLYDYADDGQGRVGDYVSFRTIDFSRVDFEKDPTLGAVEHWLSSLRPLETFAPLDDPIGVLSNPAVYLNPESWSYSVCVFGYGGRCALGSATSLQVAIVPVPTSLGFLLVAIPGFGAFVRRH